MTPEEALKATKRLLIEMGESPEDAVRIAWLMDPRSDPALRHLFGAIDTSITASA